MTEAGCRGVVRTWVEDQGRHEWASGWEASGGEVTRGRGGDAGDVDEAGVVEPVQHGVVRAARPGPGTRSGTGGESSRSTCRRRAAAADQRQTMAANSGSSGVPCVPPPCGRTRCAGINCFAFSHRPSRSIQLVEAGDFIRLVLHPQRGDGEVSAGAPAGRWTAEISPWREPRRSCRPPRGLRPRPDRSSGSAGPPGQAVFSTRRVVATLGAIHASTKVAARAPSRASASHGALRAHCPIAAKERAPVSTAEQAVSGTFTSDACRTDTAGRPESSAAGSAA